jgi:hypothetical protein
MQTVKDPLEDAINVKTRELKLGMSALGRRLEAGDESELLYWVVPDRLACAHRPLRHHPRYAGSGTILPPSATSLLFDWAEQILAAGIRSIISLMHDRDIRCYQSLDLRAANLIEFFKQRGLQVAHIPWEDPHHKTSSPSEKRKTLLRIRQEALASYDILPKPVVVQCSAGIDRSSPVAAFIWVKRTR